MVASAISLWSAVVTVVVYLLACSTAAQSPAATAAGHKKPLSRRAAAAPIVTPSAAFRAQRQFCHKYKADRANGKAITNDTLIVKVNNFTMHTYPTGDAVSASIREHKTWEANYLAEVIWALHQPRSAQHKRHRATFVDVGANVGWFALSAAADGARVIAIEGLESNVNLIRRTLCENPKLQSLITLYPVGVGEREQTCYLYSDDNNEGDAHTTCTPDEESAKKVVRPGYSLRGTMPVKLLDSLVRRPVDVMKIDTEGYEPQVIAGAPVLFSKYRVRYLFTEFTPVMIADFKNDPLTYVKTILSYGYKCSLSSFRGPYVAESEWESMAKNMKDGYNLLCTLEPPA